MKSNNTNSGAVHDLPADLGKALSTNLKAFDAWQTITPLARNEWICWTVSVKQDKTRQAHVTRACAELAAGKRRPCCWVGCIHRTDKPVGPWVRKMMLEKPPRPKQ